MRKWLVGIVFSVVISCFIVLLLGEKAQAATTEVYPLIVDSLKEAKDMHESGAGILYSMEPSNTPTVYEFTVAERGWFGIIGRSNHHIEVYSDDSLNLQDFGKTGEWVDPNKVYYCWYNYYYVEAGTYFIKDYSEREQQDAYAFFIPDSKVVTPVIKKAADGKSYSVTLSFAPTSGITGMVSNKVPVEDVYNYEIWESPDVVTNTRDTYVISDNGEYTILVRFSDPDWERIRILYSFSVNDLKKDNDNVGNGNEDKKTPIEEVKPVISKDTEEEVLSVPIGTVFTDKTLNYKVTSDDEVTVTGLKDKNAKTITIPMSIKYDGQPFDVVSIEKNAFANNKKITKVTIKADLDSIGANAFSGCVGMTRLDITGDVIEIWKKAFFKCKKLGQIYITTDAIEKVGTKAFSRIKSTVKVKVPKGMQKSYSAFLKKGGLPSKAKVKE